MATETPATPRKKNTYSRPRSSAGKLTRKQVEAALRAAAGIRSVAAMKLGVHRSTITRFMQRHPELELVEAEIVDDINDLAVVGLIELIRQKDFAAIKYWLDEKGQALGFGKRRMAFSDGDGNILIPGVVIAPVQSVDVEEWQRRHTKALH